MFETVYRRKLRQVLPWLIVAAIGAIYLWHFDNQNNDFQVFYKAGIEFRDGVNPWTRRIDPNALFLNGPSTLILFSFLSLLPQELALFLVRITSLLMVMLTVNFVRNFSLKLYKPQLILVLFLSFPVRSAMEYGQLTVVFSAMAFFVITQIYNRSKDTPIIVLSVALILDFKPHIFVGLLIYLILMQRVRLLIRVLLVWLLFQLIVGLYIRSFPIIEMLKAIQFRSDTVAQGEDSFSIVSYLSIGAPWALILTLTSTLVFLIYSIAIRLNAVSKLQPVIAFSLLITPLLHPTDLLLLLFVFILKFEFSYFNLLILGMFFVWSPQLSGAGFTLVCIMTFIYFSILLDNQVSISKMTLMFLPNLIYLSLVGFGLDEVSVRHSIHLCIPIFLGFYYSFCASKIDSDTAKSG
jgi:hypothetical protein